MSENIVSILRNAFVKSSFMLSDKYLEKNEIILRHVETMIGLLTISKKERGIVLHHGTRIPLYFAIVLACFKTYLSDERDNTAFLDDLNTGDLVLYENKRGIYKGRDPNGKIIIVNADKGGTRTTNYIPITLANKVQPYFGDGKTLDGRGIKRKRNVMSVISELFDIKNEEIKSVINKSVLIVCDKIEADEIIGSMSLKVNDKRIKMGELFPAAYITPNEIHHYPGNTAKSDPVIRFVNKLSLARELIIENKSIETVIINGSEYFVNDTSEIASIYERSSLKSIILLGEICKGINSPVFNEMENLKPFIWTNDTTIQSEEIVSEQQENEIHEESKLLQRLIFNYKNIEKETVLIDGPFDNDEFFQCKKNLLQLSKQIDDSDKKEFFIKKAYWLLNLLERSFFPISVMEKMVSNGQINAPSPNSELDLIKKIMVEFMGTKLESIAREIVENIDHIKTKLEYTNPKFNYLLEKIKDSKISKRKLSIICAKTYYQKVFWEAAPEYLRETVDKCAFFTPNKYSSSILFHQVYVVGIWDWTKLNPLLFSNSKVVSFVMYKNEIKKYYLAAEVTKNKLVSLQKRNLLIQNNETLDQDDSKEVVVSVDAELDERYLEDQLEIFTDSISLSFSSEDFKFSSNTGMQTSEIVRVALLETGEKILFTRYYSAYVFDSDRQVVKETDVSSLNVGDFLIFTSYDSGTRDIVERILEIILESEDCSDQFREANRKSIHWKQVLKDYIYKKRISYKELSDMMADAGAWKHEVTLRTWLDEASHIVGPRDLDSYKTIAKITKDPEMLSNPETYHQSSREVRSMRIRILKYLGKNIIKNYNKNKDVYDEILSKLPIDLSKMSRLLQIEKIIKAENLVVPSHLANKPIIS
ncbi:DrmE family protein [Paenibacillus thermotolerans]|uniref:DrmE family protein n=1 Tax=Paenibacillus thermotolerans TaxID=3027807 RepID=UPI0023687B25|nr:MULTISPECIES: DrmE family protein [unclassified Paenibacillus]